MSLNVSSLSKYTDETSSDLIYKSIMSGNTAEMISVMPGIKSSKTINRLASTIYMQAGNCGFTDSGSTALDQVNLTVKDIKINENICLNTLEDYYTQVMMRPGSYNEDIPFVEIFANEKSELISKEIDKMIWQGNISTGSGNLSLVDGFIVNIDDQSGSTAYQKAKVDWSGVTTSSGIAIDDVDDLIANIPTDIKGLKDLTLFVSHSQFQYYLIDLRKQDYYHFAPDFNIDNGIIHPGSNVRIVPVTGLQGSNVKILTPASNLYLGTDLLDDIESFRIWYSEDTDYVKFSSKFKIGVAVAWINFVVYSY